MPVDGRFAAVEETFTIVPTPRSRIHGKAARVARTALIRLISNDACQISSVTSSSFRISL